MPNIADLNPEDISAAPSAPIAAAGGNVFSTNPGDIQTQDEFNAQKYGTAGQQALTIGEGLAKGALGPVATGAEALATKAGITGLTPQDQAARNKANPIESTLSEIGGFGGSLFTGEGIAPLIGKIGEAAKGIAKVSETTPIVSKLIQSGIQGGAELAALQAGDEISKAINQDPGFGLGSAAINIGLSGIIGATGGAALGSVSPLWKTFKNISGTEQLATDFMAETKYLRDNPDLVHGSAQEVTGRMNEADQILNQVSDLKGQVISKTLPEATPANIAKIDDHLQEIANQGQKRIDEASKNAYLKGATSKLTQDLNDFVGVITSPEASIEQKWDALNDYKKATQAHANYNTVVGGPEDKALSKWIKPFASDLKEAAENTKVWGEAGNVQKKINGSLADLFAAQKDFLPKVTAPELGDRVASPDKLQSLINQADKGKGGSKLNSVRNYLEATQDVADSINKVHIDNGLEAPLASKLNPTPILDHTLNAPISAGRTLAQWGNKSGATALAHAAGNTGAGVLGGALGSLVGHPLLGAWASEKILAPVFSVLAKPFAEKAVDSGAMKSAVDYVANAVKGTNALNDSVRNFFKSGEVLPEHLFKTTDERREKLEKTLNAINDDPAKMTTVGGVIGHYLPDHASAAGTMAAVAQNYLNNLKPKQVTNGPLDATPPIDKAQLAKYNRALDIAQQPLLVLQHAKNGTLQGQDVATLNTIFPSLHSKIVQGLTNELIDSKTNGINISYKQKTGLSLLMGQPLDSTMTQSSMAAVIGANATSQTSQTQPKSPKKASNVELKQINKVNALYQTPSEVRASDRRS